MKKLVLKKDVVARIDNGSMNQLKGGSGYTINDATCGHTCNWDATCAKYETCGTQETCQQTCGDTACYTFDKICAPSAVQSQYTTCYIRCTIPNY